VVWAEGVFEGADHDDFDGIVAFADRFGYVALPGLSEDSACGFAVYGDSCDAAVPLGESDEVPAGGVGDVEFLGV